MKGYAGRLAYVDLTAGACTTTDLDEGFARKYLGGNGFAAKIIYDRVPPEVAPVSPDNVVVFAQGPANGSPFWGSNRGLVASISPATGGFFDSVYGGDFAWAMKQAGWDAVVISGKAERPVSVTMSAEAVAIEASGDLWGLSVDETIRRIKEKHGKASEAAIIGPAGENGALCASVMASGRRVSAAGRGGIGSVLGAKNCKALIATGKRPCAYADGDGVKELFESMKTALREKGAGLAEMGTPLLVDMINDKDMLCTRNNTREQFAHADRIGGELIRDTYKRRNVACRGCGLACGKFVEVPRGHYAGRLVKMPEYETLYALGSMLENDDIVSIFNANARCDELGIDTISLGVSLAFLIECAERGLIDSADLHFGAQDALSGLVEETAENSSEIGKLLAMGSARAAETIGSPSDELLYAVKGLEIAGHSARSLRMMGISYAVSPRGGSHHDGRPLYTPTDPDVDPGFESAVKTCIDTHNNSTIGDSLVLCRFIQERTFGYELNERYVEYIRTLTGWSDYSLSELRETAERICALERQIAVDRGFDRTHDTLPHRVRTQPVPSGKTAGRHCAYDALEAQLDEYYSLRRWDANGKPTLELLAELGIEPPR